MTSLGNLFGIGRGPAVVEISFTIKADPPLLEFLKTLVAHDEIAPKLAALGAKVKTATASLKQAVSLAKEK